MRARSVLALSGAILAIAASGCDASVSDPSDDRFTIRLSTLTVLHGDAEPYVELRVQIHPVDCDACDEQIEAIVRAGPESELIDLPWDAEQGGYRGFAPAPADAYALEITIGDRTIALTTEGVAMYEISLSPDPPILGDSVTVMWTGANPTEHRYAGVTVETPFGERLTSPPSNVGDDDGEETLPASAFTDAGTYHFTMQRSFYEERVLPDGDEFSVDAFVQRDFDEIIR